jgi:hypothetical protein
MSARQLYERFRGKLAKKFLAIGIRYAGRALTEPGKLNIDIPAELAVIGHLSALEYDAVYDGKLTKARHAFAPGSRPLMVVGTDRGQTFLIGRGYRFTDRGFLDFNAQGQAIEYLEKKCPKCGGARVDQTGKIVRI